MTSLDYDCRFSSGFIDADSDDAWRKAILKIAACLTVTSFLDNLLTYLGMRNTANYQHEGHLQ